jgi:hypothetical protein
MAHISGWGTVNVLSRLSIVDIVCQLQKWTISICVFCVLSIAMLKKLINFYAELCRQNSMLDADPLSDFYEK